MITYGVVILFILKSINAPWWVYVPVVAIMVIHLIEELMGIYEAGKESK